MILLIFLLSTNSCPFLRLSPGVVSQGLGGIVSVIDEGLSVFHNPALVGQNRLNFTLGRWLYDTNFLTFGGTYQRYSFGINYLNYGAIQGYDEFGVPTRRFTPYDLFTGAGIKIYPFGFNIKGFREQIDSLSLFGFSLGLSAHLDFKKIFIGSKIENLGKEFNQNVFLSPVIINGVKFALSDSFEIFLETKVPEIELSSGLLYLYQNIKIFGGFRYLAPEGEIKKFTTMDLNFSGGITIKLEEYEIGYSFLWTKFSQAHRFSIILSL
uniref:PorV/PorQ family protein n=1 Tax=candidate division WOR-3 bacterium TaxID=2052148 RepID=A0A7C4TCF6_UNCW3